MNPQVVSAEVSPDQCSLLVRWADSTRGEFASVWLRDNLPEDRDPFSGQRLIDVADLPAEPRIRSVAVADGQVRIAWVDEPRDAAFAGDWLYANSNGQSESAAAQARPWLEGEKLDARRDFAWQTLASIGADAGARLDWLTRLLQDGIAFLSEVPREDPAILAAMAHVGRVAETNYGLVFDVKAVPQPENLAYSDVGLGLHTDNPYREPVPGYQVLHTLLAAPDGGDSLFADGFALAEHLRHIDAEAFGILTRTVVPFRYRSRSADLYAERPLIALDCAGAISAVHYNSRSIAPLRLPVAEYPGFYRAYRRFAGVLRERRFQLTTRLGNGELVVFDNQRILHGRTGFASANHPRHLRGCYLTRDSVRSAQALLQRESAS
jgi:gamma-butyrobetaine dioxygenase